MGQVGKLQAMTSSGSRENEFEANVQDDMGVGTTIPLLQVPSGDDCTPNRIGIASCRVLCVFAAH